MNDRPHPFGGLTEILDAPDLRDCRHEGQDSWWEYDARGIELCKVCDKCRAAKLAQFRPDVLSDPQYWADEDIEPEPDVGVSTGDLARDAKDPHDIYS